MKGDHLLDQNAYMLMTSVYRLVLAHTSTHFKAVKALRKEVLLEKYRNFATIEDEEAFAWDESDEQSFLYLIEHRESGRFVGTIRVFFINERTPLQKMPMEHYTYAPRIAELKSKLPVCEISRFALSKNLPTFQNRHALWIRTHLSLLLMIGTRITAQVYPFAMIFAIMEHSLARLLRYQHAYFEQIGESVDYYGLRTPFVVEPQKLIAETSATEEISRFYRERFCAPEGDIRRFITKNPYLSQESFICPPDRSLHTSAAHRRG